jgi:hypothetical protein
MQPKAKTAGQSNKRPVIVIPHTHWDREWSGVAHTRGSTVGHPF